MEDRTSGFREIEHTADWELEAWAPDLVGLFEQAARGMYELSGIRLQTSPRIQRDFRISGVDPESLLVNFLTELLFFNEQEGLAFDHFDLVLIDDTVEVKCSGAPVAAQDKEIKAVTYHNLEVRRLPQGLAVNLVFDV